MMQKGFTLIELMITVALAAIILAMGLPSMQEMVIQNRLTTTSNRLLSSFIVAHSEAVKRGARVMVCPSDDQKTCSDKSPDWTQGWITFVDSNVDNQRQATGANVEELIKVNKGVNERYFIGAVNKNELKYMFYKPSGKSENSISAGGLGNVTILVCKKGSPDALLEKYARGIVSNSLGRVEIRSGSQINTSDLKKYCS